jgi:hypothetical protein
LKKNERRKEGGYNEPVVTIALVDKECTGH